MICFSLFSLSYSLCGIGTLIVEVGAPTGPVANNPGAMARGIIDYQLEAAFGHKPDSSGHSSRAFPEVAIRSGRAGDAFPSWRTQSVRWAYI
jgi:hypothetical protein